jgi:hypothetical protein
MMLAGAHDKKVVMKISQEMEYISKNGGFLFMETVMTGDPLGETG